MTPSPLAKLLVLGVLPLVHALIGGMFAFLLGFSVVSAAMQTLIALVLLSVAAFTDFLREEESSHAADGHNLMVREGCAFALPFVFMAACVASHVAIGAAMRPTTLVLPFLAGMLVGRSAIEYHYFARPRTEALFEQPSIFYHDEDRDE